MDKKLVKEMIKKAVRAGVVSNKLYPIFCGSALGNKGVQLMLGCSYWLSSMSIR
jgi:translation elongation factor EF-G